MACDFIFESYSYKLKVGKLRPLSILINILIWFFEVVTFYIKLKLL